MKAVFFDLDGTLVDTIGDIARVCNIVLQQYGIPPMLPETYAPWVGRGLKHLLLSVMEEHAVTEAPEKVFIQIVAEYLRTPVLFSKVFSGIVDLLWQFSQEKVPMAILSNKEQLLTEAVVEDILPKEVFFSVRGSNDRFPTKPDPGQALDLAKEISCNPEDVLFVGDSIFDMQTAKNAGMRPLWVNWGYGIYPAEADYRRADGVGDILTTFTEERA